MPKVRGAQATSISHVEADDEKDAICAHTQACKTYCFGKAIACACNPANLG